MRKKDIIVGKRYTNDATPSSIYLGVGMRKLWTSRTFTKKHLVIIESDWKQDIGLLAQEGDNAVDGFWDKFREIK